MKKRLENILDFLVEAEKFKLVERIPVLSDQIRRENDAEHSWHLALMVMALKKELGIDFDELKALKLAILHDMVEIKTGDSWPENDQEKEAKKQREIVAAEEVFVTLPNDLQAEFHALWQEYDDGQTVEAKVVKALDKICYPLQYSISDKIVWHKPESEGDERRAYALPHTQFNNKLTEILDHFLEKVEENKSRKD